MVLPFLKLFSLAKTAKGLRDGNNGATQKAKTPMSRTNKLRILAIFPILATGIALLLALLCIYAGHKPGYMEDYAVFTLNLSRIGENVLQSLDSKISSVHLKRDVASPVSVPAVAIITAPPTTTFITVVNKGLGSVLNSLTSDAGSDLDSLTSNAGSEIQHATSVVHSKITSAETAVASAASSAVAGVQTNLINMVNKAYHGAIDELDLKDFYSIHISSSCSGTYEFKNGTNVTIGDSGTPTKKDGVHEHVDSCSKHEAVDPLQLIKILYWVGIVLAGLPLALGLFGFVRPTKKVAGLNIVATIPAFLLLSLASAVTHGVSVGAAKFVNFVGHSIGVAGYSGQKFLHLTWAAVILLIVNMGLWGLIFLFAGKTDGQQGPKTSGGGIFGFGRRKRADRTSGIAMGPISHPQPAHVDRNGNTMI